jgi:hypothetical protein
MYKSGQGDAFIDAAILNYISLDLKLKRSSLMYPGVLLLQSALNIRGIRLLTALLAMREN